MIKKIPAIDGTRFIVSHPAMSQPKPRKSISSHRWILGYLMKEKAIFFPSLFALFFTAMLSLAFPWFLKELIGNPTDALKNGVDPQAILAKSDRVVLSLVAVLAVQAFIAFFRVIGFIRSVESAMNHLRRDLFAHLVRLPIPFFQEERAGALSTRFSADLGVVRDTLLNTVPQAVRQTVILIGGLIFIFVASWKLSLIMLGSVPFVVLAIAFFGRKVRGFSKAAQASLAEAGTVVEETVQGIADVKSYTNEPYEATRYDRSLASFFGVTMRVPCRERRFFPSSFSRFSARSPSSLGMAHGCWPMAKSTARTSFPSFCSRSSSAHRSARFLKSSRSFNKRLAPRIASVNC